jgi:putative oxidoreductase
MKLAVTICRILLGFMFTVFGLNGFFHFIPQPPPANPLAVQYMTVLSVSHYFAFVFFVQVIAGILLLSGRFVPLALTLLAPVIVNVLLYHSLLDPAGLPVAGFAAILWIVVFVHVRAAFNGLFQSRAVAQS